MNRMENLDKEKLATWIVAYAEGRTPEELVEKICAEHPMHQEERAELVLTIRQMIDSRALFLGANGKLTVEILGV